MSIFQGVPAHKKDMKKRPKNKGKEMYGKVKPFLEGRFYPSLSFKKKTEHHHFHGNFVSQIHQNPSKPRR